ncbi:Partner and localizer of BRCA2 [Dissostichus eleginoides]|uniref:Partner and localizer of BRCA2 n=1 Tax=Dissostichus eleginoides TaxID=100907 RepID=A0AAD9BN92_DISEL|nr:Partner and localizer of BRCA2 [Dissostichus eleginoides]
MIEHQNKLSMDAAAPSEQKAEPVGDNMPFDEQLRTTLHCDDKEKLRRKLALLQREYLKTAQRLQRAERFDAERKQVRSRISQQNQGDPDVTSNPRLSPSPLILNATNGAATSEAQCEGHTGGPVDSDNSRRSQVIRFLLPSEDPCTETLTPSHDTPRGHRSSPALRLRSRRSRLRWEKRSAEAGRSTDDNSEEGQEPSERMVVGSEGGDKTQGTEVVNEGKSYVLPAEPNTQSSSEISDRVSGCQINTDACFSPIVTSARPARGRRKKRGRRGRPQTPRCSLSLDSNQLGLAQKTSDDPPATSSQVDSSPSLHGAYGSKPSISPVQHVPQPASTNSTDTPPSSGVIVDPSSSASGPLGKVFPIFRKSGERSNRSTQISRDAASWQCLLLPSSPPTQPSLLPLPSLFPGSLFNNFDTIQDFHLPDDQFAFLKLHKLRQVSVASEVERFTSPSYNTRRSSRRFVSSDSERRLPLPLSLTPTITKSPHTAAASHSDLQNVSIKYSQSLTEDPEQVIKETLGEQQPENLQIECQSCTTSTVSEPGVQDRAGDCVDQYKKQESMILNTHHTVEPQPHISFADRPVEQETPEEPSISRAAEQLCNVSEAQGESPVQNLPRARSMENQNKCVQPHSSQLLLSPALTSAPFITQPPPSSALLSSPTLPSLGLTPRLLPPPSSALLSSPTLPSLGLTPRLLPPPSSALLSSPTLPSLGLTPRLLPSSPSAPPLTMPPPHSPSIQALSPPAISPCPSQIHQIQASSEPCTDSQAQRVEAPPCRTVSGILPQGSGGRAETAEEHMMRCTHTLKAPAGGCLVDACLLRGSSGGLCVAAAGKWAVCLWSQTAASDWSLTHTWAFNEPVIDVFPVPDAAGLICVTLGQLEIREVRMLSCCSLSQLLLCDGVVQAVVCVSRSRVVTSSHSASGSSLQVFTLPDSGSTPGPQPLVSPGVCVGALAAVAGLPDALIGSDESGRLFVWNLKMGQLLQRIILGEDLSHMACLTGYSYSGVLFVLLQHQLLSSLEEEVKEKEEESKNMALFSLVAINPLSGKSTLATRLYPPNAWSGRLCEADVSGSSVVGLSQSGCVCVWQLGPRAASRMVQAPRMVPAPESEGWQLARWGGEGTLLTGHHNGDVTLHLRLDLATSQIESRLLTC